ncbi:hypothetical protein I545_2038 [Mycobacterium kansasii 662]|uniref:Uncharacterized protein n=2 Tax=Mycobacterium kansasii TaxID=1768 RepID=A0A1V3XMW9_MYCKA|nr:hypothetical protein I547_3876 [Mycobacterium kansasii 824]EUA19721.1 hypothetical protein I545_2038 [Mycobacterium kansasii 662]KEP40029.1 hypothetical protein MKSMC1_48400 [Mycobacterium kansasii]OOK78240.1 hypothetical protein BZL30_2250 [Mycobacterium kansasii]OOK80545.1 hypothetical protein BZL29_2241 [Mycobacterium kansasii]
MQCFSRQSFGISVFRVAPSDKHRVADADRKYTDLAHD